jgi:predicted nucleic acid-binding protein
VTLVDTSVWVDHLRHDNDDLRALLNRGDVLCHPFIIGEVACGSIRNRVEILDLLRALPAALIAEHDEVMEFLQQKRLYGRGLGWIDVHLLASASLTKATLWTMDRPLKTAFEHLGR